MEGVFFRRVGVIEWHGGDVKFGELTRKKFIECFRKVYGIEPFIAEGIITGENPSIPVASSK